MQLLSPDQHVSASDAAFAVFRQKLDDASRAPAAALPQRMIEALGYCPSSESILTDTQREGCDAAYQRHVLYAPDNGRLCAVALVWRPGQQTPVHGHYTWCAYRVMQGTMEETLYHWQADRQSAVPHDRHLRHAGYAVASHAGMDATHRLRNAGNGIAVSVHVYGVHGEQICTHVNRIAAVEAAGSDHSA